MEINQLPVPQLMNAEQQHHIIQLVLIGITCTWAIVFVIGIGLSHGPWAAWWSIAVLGMAVMIIRCTQAAHEKYKDHQLHQPDIKDREHHHALAQMTISLDHSAEHITATSSFRAFSKYMDPAGSITIKDNNLGQAQLTAASPEQPRLETIIEDLTENALEFAYGYDPKSGQIVKATLSKAVYIQLVVASDQGKSRQATSILTQLCARNDPHHLQLALIDHEGETSAPFQGLPHIGCIADEPKEAARIFRASVKELDRRDIGRIAMPVILMFCEEFLNLCRSMPVQYRDQALGDYTTLALCGRKRGMFLFSVGQTAYTEKSIRDAQAQFLSSMAFAVKPSAARSAGFTNTDLLNRLYSERKPGQFLLERPEGDALLLAPYVDTRTIHDLLTVECSPENDDIDEVRKWIESGQKVGSNEPRNQSDDALEAKSLQVCSFLAQGIVNKAETIQAVWNAKPSSSKKYRSAEAEYRTIMAQLAQK